VRNFVPKCRKISHTRSYRIALGENLRGNQFLRTATHGEFAALTAAYTVWAFVRQRCLRRVRESQIQSVHENWRTQQNSFLGNPGPDLHQAPRESVFLVSAFW